MSASWSVVTTSVEPVDVLVAFARHHLALGASRVHIFLDHPTSSDATRLSIIPGVVVTVCDRAYWRGRHEMRRPKAVERRQLSNAHHVANVTDSKWLIHLDSDEFIHAQSPVEQMLGAVPDGIDVVRLMPMERVYLGHKMPTDLFEGGFRLISHHSPEALKYLLAPEMAATGTYFLGHVSGKSFTRIGRDLLMGIHRPRPRNVAGQRRATEMHAPGMGVLHFDGFTPLHWIAKLQGYMDRNSDGPGSVMQKGGINFMQLVRDAEGDPQRLGKIFAQAKRIRPERARQLRNLGLLAEFEDWRPSMDVPDPGPLPDLSVSAFDRHRSDLKDKLSNYAEMFAIALAA